MYFSELFYKPDGLVKDAVQVPVRTVGECPSQIADNDNQICTLFPTGSRRVLHDVALPHLSGNHPLSNRYPSGPAEIFATQFHSCLVGAPISDTTSLP